MMREAAAATLGMPAEGSNNIGLAQSAAAFHISVAERQDRASRM
jgi:hypothetical protein